MTEALLLIITGWLSGIGTVATMAWWDRRAKQRERDRHFKGITRR